MDSEVWVEGLRPWLRVPQWLQGKLHGAKLKERDLRWEWLKRLEREP